MVSHLPNSVEVFGDIDGFRAFETLETTLPLDILVTAARPDIVVINRTKNAISIIELTIPFDSQESLDRAHIFKTKKICSLVKRP